MDRVWPYYLKTGKNKYKNRESQEVALRHLFKLANGDEREAIEALQYAVANSYQGFQWYFKHKQQGNGTGTTTAERKGVSSDEAKRTLDWIRNHPGLRHENRGDGCVHGQAVG